MSDLNLYLLISGAIALFTAFLHLIAGHFHPVLPFLSTRMDDRVKGTFYACWHMVTVLLFASAVWFLFSAYVPVDALSVQMLSGQFILFGLVFLAVGRFLKIKRAWVRLPQWILLIPIGVFGFLGSV